MKHTKARRALMRLARQEGASMDAVRREIEAAIALASGSADPKAQAFWDSVPHKGERPTPEEVIDYIADRMKR